MRPLQRRARGRRAAPHRKHPLSANRPPSYPGREPRTGAKNAVYRPPSRWTSGEPPHHNLRGERSERGEVSPNDNSALLGDKGLSRFFEVGHEKSVALYRRGTHVKG